MQKSKKMQEQEKQQEQEKHQKKERKTLLDISLEDPKLAFQLKHQLLPQLKKELTKEIELAYKKDYDLYFTISFELYALEKLEQTNNILCFVSYLFNPDYDYKEKYNELSRKNNWSLDKWIKDWLENKLYEKIKRKFSHLAVYKYKQPYHPFFTFVEKHYVVNAIRRKKIHFFVVNRKIFATLYAPARDTPKERKKEKSSFSSRIS
jgi:hypothetical protein